MLHISGVARRLTHSRSDYSTWVRMRGEQQRARQRRKKIRIEEIAKLREYIRSGQAAAGNTSSSTRKLGIQKLEQEAVMEAEELAALAEDEELPLFLQAGGMLERP